jgi:2-oxoglutarate ferredoxin oxidoreductase subunit alpha
VLKLCNVWPVPEEQIDEVSRQVKKIFAVEMNIGKYAAEIERVAAGRCSVQRVTKNQGLVHTPDEIYRDVLEGVK